MTRYDIHITREGKWWMIAIPAIDGLTQARRLADVEAEARSYIAVHDDVVPSSIGIQVTSFKIGNAQLDDRMTQVTELRAKEAEIRRQLSALTAEVAHELHDAAVPLRDIGTALGLSHQRAHQLVSRS